MSSNTKKIYTIQQNLTCDSTYTVYLATCKKCNGQYVGKSSQTFKKRHSGNKQEVKNRIGGLGGHYGGSSGCGYDQFSVQIIDQVEHGDDEALAQCETFWQHQLRCYVENGGRAHCYRKEITRTRIWTSSAQACWLWKKIMKIVCQWWWETKTKTYLYLFLLFNFWICQFVVSW